MPFNSHEGGVNFKDFAAKRASLGFTCSLVHTDAQNHLCMLDVLTLLLGGSGEVLLDENLEDADDQTEASARTASA